MIRATFDTNVFLSGFTSPLGTPATLVERWIFGAFEMASSQYILKETETRYERPYLLTRSTARERAANLETLRSRAMFFEPDPTVVGICRGPDDDAILGTAVAAKADYLVTGDRDLLALGSFRETRIVMAREFLAMLDAAADEPEGETTPA